MKNLLKKWINGSVTWSEEKQLRQAAEKDHFLGEAMEGYDAFPITDHAAKIAQLKGRFRQPKKEEKRRLIMLSRIAAAAAIIGVIGTFFWVQNELEQPTILSKKIEQSKALPFEQNKEEDLAVEAIIADEQAAAPIAKNEKNEVIKPTIQPVKEPTKKTNKTIARNASASSNFKQSTPSTIIANNEISEVEVATPARTVEVPTIVSAPEYEPTTTDESIIIAEAVAPELEAEADFQSTPVPPPAADITYSAQSAPIIQAEETKARQSTAKKKQRKTADKINYYVGQVKNEDGQPMDAAKIEGLNTPFNTISERNGEFTLAVDSPLTKITVSKDGFHTRKIDINQYTDFLNVALVRKSTFPADVADKKAALLEPKPAAGFMEFFKYLENNRIYPAAAKEKGIEQAVEIHFYIDENGQPTNLKVVNPDSYGFDKEAIRLLEKGPKWTPINSAARYYISFELE